MASVAHRGTFLFEENEPMATTDGDPHGRDSSATYQRAAEAVMAALKAIRAVREEAASLLRRADALEQLLRAEASPPVSASRPDQHTLRRTPVPMLRETILRLAGRAQGVARADIRAEVRLSMVQTTRHLSAMVAAGLLRREGEQKSTRYYAIPVVDEVRPRARTAVVARKA